MRHEPCVYLIGAGPGDPGLFTIRGKECLEQADVVIYDYLANECLLHYVDPSAERIFVGKKGYSEHVTQEEINRILVEKATQEGITHVARLKGGDPFLFGRGGEEALALAREGISFEVVPGVTAGIAAPAYAGIPVTHRGVASSVAFITGHEDPTKDESAIDWKRIAQGADTLCFYMGIQALPLITRRLIEAGRSAETPVSLVRWGTTPSQEVLVSTLDDVADEADRVGFRAPAIIVVGEVVDLCETLAWFERDKPLSGKTVVVTRSRTQASKLCDLLRRSGAETFEFPTIDIVPPPSFEFVDEAVRRLDGYDWVVFTSTNGVDRFFDRLRVQNKDTRAFGKAKVAAIGPSTADELVGRGIVPDAIPPEYRAEGVVGELIEAGVKAGDRVLIPRALSAREVLPEALRERGVVVDVVPVYETVVDGGDLMEELVAKLSEGSIDLITFTSSSTVGNCMRLVAEHAGGVDPEAFFQDIDVASIGPITTATARSHGLAVDIEAEDYTIEGLVDAIEAFYESAL